MCGKTKGRKLVRRPIRSNQSRPIILNRKSFSSSSIPRKKRDLELQRTSRDESQIIQLHNDISESVHSQTMPMPSHKWLIEDVQKFSNRHMSTGYSSYNNVQQSYNVYSGNQQLPLFQHGRSMMASNPYMLVSEAALNGPRNTKPVVMYNTGVNTSSDRNVSNFESPNMSFLSTNNGKENVAREIPIATAQSMEPVFLKNSTDVTKLFDVNQQFHPRGVSIGGSNTNDVMNDSLNAISWMGQMEATNILPSIDPPRNFETGRPPYSYMALIQFAINSSPTQRMTLKQIYKWIEETFPYFKRAKPGWKNSIRHNLSLHDIFIREILPTSKSSYWTLRPDLNQRPLTLACVAARMGNIQPVPFSTIGVGGEEMRGLQQVSNIATQPYVLMPFNQNCSTPIVQPNSCPSDSQSSSFTTSRTKNPVNDAVCNLKMDDLSLSRMNDNKKEQSIRKRKRKQPLEILNDSLNDSLHFTESLISPLVSPLLQDVDKKCTALRYCESTPSTSMWVKKEPRRTSIDESESGYFEQTRSSIASADLFVTPQSHCDINNAEGAGRSSTIQSELSYPKETRDVDADFSIFARNEDTESSYFNGVAGSEYAMTDGIPQLLGMEGFSFNSSFAKLLNSSNVSLFNLSDRSVQFSDFEDM